MNTNTNPQPHHEATESSYNTPFRRKRVGNESDQYDNENQKNYCKVPQTAETVPLSEEKSLSSDTANSPSSTPYSDLIRSSNVKRKKGKRSVDEVAKKKLSFVEGGENEVVTQDLNGT